ncbi:hypothetical protein BHE74_00045347 [Ensete ventricosum]|nr:hypothetical protein BHE74_00045347 [Ensete ventricosum]
MERARKLASRGILRRLISQTNSSAPTPATTRHLSSLASSSVFPTGNSLIRPPAAADSLFRNGQYRSISVDALRPSDTFPRRHNSATPDEQSTMAASCGFSSLDALIDATVPKSIRIPDMKFAKFDGGLTESEMIAHMSRLAAKNKVFKSFIGMGYYDTLVPAVILRNIMENPAWYTQYTPYQAEISQGRLESLLNFQTMISDLTALPMSNASLLDEGTAAAEAMAMCSNIEKGKKKTFFIASNCHPQTIDICKTRAEGFDIKVAVANLKDFDYTSNDVCGVLVQYPGTEGEILDYGEFIKNAHAHGVKVVMATDLLALTVLKPPGELGADIVVGSAQRFGVPMGYGGPHAAFLATSQEYKRMMPGRIIGVSVDSSGKPALRMAMQTREQHIRRDKATSNICTAQVGDLCVNFANRTHNLCSFVSPVSSLKQYLPLMENLNSQALLANMAAMYAVYHGPEGLKAIAQRIHGLSYAFASGLKKLGTVIVQDLPFFDTVKVTCSDSKAIADEACKHGMNLRVVDSNTVRDFIKILYFNG